MGSRSSDLAHTCRHDPFRPRVRGTEAFGTANIKDFAALDRQRLSGGQSHGGIILISTKRFPQNRALTGAVVVALNKLLQTETQQHEGWPIV